MAADGRRAVERQFLLSNRIVKFLEHYLDLEFPSFEGAFEWCLDEDVAVICWSRVRGGEESIRSAPRWRSDG
jgi:hypothetical protein